LRLHLPEILSRRPYALDCPAEKATATATLEKRLWDAADQFRANSAAMILLLLLHCGIGLNAAAPDKPAKVFILAGQSNMEGKAPNALFDHQATDPRTKDSQP
jgi:hypothetical protein